MTAGGPRWLELDLDPALRSLVTRRFRNRPLIRYLLERRASIKDILESMGIPHTEIGSIIVCGQPVDFGYIPEAGQTLSIGALIPGTDVTRPTLLRPEPLPALRFLVDINVGKLARLLRMAGLDTRYEPGLSDGELAALAGTGPYILLSRNRELLKRKEVVHGRLIRAGQPEEQLFEVIDLYNLSDALKPFCRCLACNTPLLPVEKKTILDRLEPLTRKYYHRFKICPGCGRIYWQGSHHAHMMRLVRRIQSRCRG